MIASAYSMLVCIPEELLSLKREETHFSLGMQMDRYLGVVNVVERAREEVGDWNEILSLLADLAMLQLAQGIEPPPAFVRLAELVSMARSVAERLHQEACKHADFDMPKQA
jgi:hypothetical protein